MKYLSNSFIYLSTILGSLQENVSWEDKTEIEQLENVRGEETIEETIERFPSELHQGIIQILKQTPQST